MDRILGFLTRAADALRVETDSPPGNLNAAGVAFIAALVVFALVFRSPAFFSGLLVYWTVIFAGCVWLLHRHLDDEEQMRRC